MLLLISRIGYEEKLIVDLMEEFCVKMQDFVFNAPVLQHSVEFVDSHSNHGSIDFMCKAIF